MDGNLQIAYDEAGDLLYEDPAAPEPRAMTGGHFQNIAEGMDDQDLDALSTMLTEHISFDEDQRGPWEDMVKENYALLGVGPESEPDDVDEDGSSDKSDHPLLLTALTRFISKAGAALLPSSNEVCKYRPMFDRNAVKDVEERRQKLKEAADAGRRVEEFYSDYLYNVLPSYVADTDQILMEMGLNGLGVRKIFTDTTNKTSPVQMTHVPVDDMFFSYDAKSFNNGRITHRMQMPTPDLIRLINGGQYRDIGDLEDGEVPDKTVVTVERDRIVGLSMADLKGTESHKIYEIHCDLFLMQDAHPMSLARPYIVTIHARSMEILSIVRNWRANDPSERRIEHFIGYLFFPGKNSLHGMGLGHLLANITRSLRKAQRRGLEAAYLQNHPSGFKLSSFKVRDDSTKIRSGEFIDVDSPTGDIRSALMMHPFEGPSQGLMALSEKMEGNGKQLGGLATQDLDNLMKAGMAAGPAMAAYEENTEFQSAVHSRLYRAHALELKLMHERMREIIGSRPMSFDDNSKATHAGDFLKVGILPRMKPGQASKQKEVLEAQAVLDLSTAFPDEIDRRQAAMDYLAALGKPNIDDVMKPDPNDNPPKPMDPASEYAALMMGQPIKAGMSQNHMAHIDAHAAQMRGLQTTQLPIEKGEAMMATIAAHIAEHYAQDTLVKAAAAIGVPVEQLGEEMPPEMEAQIAPQLAEAIKQIEAERAPPEQQEESKAQIEAIKGRNQQTLETMRQSHATEMASMKQRHEAAMQKARDDAALERATMDDETALEIASMPDANKASAKAGVISK